MNACRSNSTGLKATTDFLFWSERDDIRKAVIARDPQICVWCHEKVGGHRFERYVTMDHIVLRRDGGPYAPDNLVPSCKGCNTERGDMSVLQFMAHRAGCEVRS